MSLEEQLARNSDALEANTKALREHTEFLRKGVGKRTPAKADVSDADAKAATKKTTAKKTTAKPKPKAMTAAQFKAKFADYLGTADDNDQLGEFKDHLRAIADYFGVDKVTSLKSENYDEALGYLAQYEAGETPEFDAVEEDDEDGVL